MNSAAEGARAFRLKIKLRLPNSATLESWLARGKNAKLHLLRLDSRLSISMGMAALSAVLALLVISGVRVNAPKAPPSRVSRNASATAVAPPAAVAVTKPSPVPTSRTSKPVAPVVKRALHSTRARKVSSPSVTRKKMHRRQEDDYVAKDTYVYYGVNGKTTR